MTEQLKNGFIFILLIAVIVLSVLLYNEKKCPSTSSRCRYGDASMCLPDEIYNIVKDQCNN